MPGISSSARPLARMPFHRSTHCVRPLHPAHRSPPIPRVPPPAEFQYVGSELALFEKARNWKTYWRSVIAPFVHGTVLEAGAGIGANTRLLRELPHSRWTALEPDTILSAQIEG